jgi:hypothetical protein
VASQRALRVESCSGSFENGENGRPENDCCRNSSAHDALIVSGATRPRSRQIGLAIKQIGA